LIGMMSVATAVEQSDPVQLYVSVNSSPLRPLLYWIFTFQGNNWSRLSPPMESKLGSFSNK
jgi:hypothetical protein